jgi:large subunit ribosomal protein L24
MKRKNTKNSSSKNTLSKGSNRMKIKKGDTVTVISGKDKGKSGEVLRAYPSESRVLVRGVNLVKKHLKVIDKKEKVEGGGKIVEIERPIHVSNVMYVDPKEKRGTRIGIVRENGKRVRVLKKSGTKL